MYARQLSRQMLRCCCQQLVQIQKPATAAFAATAKSLRAATANPYSTNNAAAETPKNTSTTTATFSLPKLSKQEIAELESKISSYSNPQTTPIKKDAIPHVSKEVVHLTDSAIGRLKYLSEQRKKTQYLRLRVDSGGCYGFSYMLDMTDEPETDDVIVDRNGAKMVVDEVSLPLVRGAIIDWQDRLIGQAFVVLANPNSSGGCGCGSSFEIKMD